jgi:small subunit ribosomal protein S14
MKKTKYNIKDHQIRLDVKKYEHKRLALKTIQHHLAFSIKKRFFAGIQLSKLKKNSSYVRIKNRCVLTGRSHGVFNYFKISRIMIRELAAQSLLPGLKKAN